MYTDDPVRDAKHRDLETQRWLDNLPHCEHCHEPIQDKEYFVIEEAIICPECLVEYCEKHYRVKNTAL